MKDIDYLKEYQKLGLRICNENNYQGPNEQAKQFVICSALRHIETTVLTVSTGYQERTLSKQK